ncbi:MAG TPA: hypothetical protein PLB78_12140, partial [Anaerolineae bacterium]|nr:hypothetical protein [Anaerolineae bacterium]
MSTLAELTTNIAADLKDAGNVTWSPEELARAVRWTLLELSRTLPRHASAVLTASEDVREYALSTTGIMHALYVVEVWHPYPAGDPEY